MFKEGFSMVSNTLATVLQVIGLKNTPDMKKADQAQKDKDKEDEINKIIQKRDTEKAREAQS